MRYNSCGCQVTEYRCLKTSRTDRLELDRDSSPFPGNRHGLQQEKTLEWEKRDGNFWTVIISSRYGGNVCNIDQSEQKTYYKQTYPAIDIIAS